MKARKFIFGLIFIAVMTVSLSGCFTIARAIQHAPGTITMDPDLPAEKAAVVVFGEMVFVKEYNGIEIKSIWYPKNRTRKMTVTMPAGETHLLFDIDASFSRGNTIYTFRPKDLEFKFDFEAGKEYTVNVYTSKPEGGNFFVKGKEKIILSVWDQLDNRNADNAVKSWELGEF